MELVDHRQVGTATFAGAGRDLANGGLSRRCVIACAFAAVLIAHPACGGDAGAPPPDGDTAASPTFIPDPLSLDQAVELFRTHGFALLLADAAVVGARGDLVSARIAQPGRQRRGRNRLQLRPGPLRQQRLLGHGGQRQRVRSGAVG